MGIRRDRKEMGHVGDGIRRRRDGRRWDSEEEEERVETERITGQELHRAGRR